MNENNQNTFKINFLDGYNGDDIFKINKIRLCRISNRHKRDKYRAGIAEEEEHIEIPKIFNNLAFTTDNITFINIKHYLTYEIARRKIREKIIRELLSNDITRIKKLIEKNPEQINNFDVEFYIKGYSCVINQSQNDENMKNQLIQLQGKHITSDDKENRQGKALMDCIENGPRDYNIGYIIWKTNDQKE